MARLDGKSLTYPPKDGRVTKLSLYKCVVADVELPVEDRRARCEQGFGICATHLSQGTALPAATRRARCARTENSNWEGARRSPRPRV